MSSVQSQKDLESGWTVYTLTEGNTVVRVVPEAGANVFSITVDGVEFLRQAEAISKLPGTQFGVPLLYPTPNRVRDGKMTFGGRTYQFPINKAPNYIHGFVHSRPWNVVSIRELADRRGTDPAASEIELELRFAPGEPSYELFPHPHILRLALRVSEQCVRWTYTVDNTLGSSRIPFGFGIHPWFRYLGPREATYLTVPATHWMEATNLLPTGTLVNLEGHPYDMRSPRSLEDFHVDDVFFGMHSDRPALIEHRAAGRSLTLSATDDFTHCVVFTPPDKGAFCVENQTCSTDAHNLHAAEITRPSHLLVVEPGASHTGHVEFKIT